LDKASERREHYLGAMFAVLSALGFAGKAIFIKVAYAKARLDATTLLALRMLFSAPFFALIVWRVRADRTLKPLARSDWAWLAWLAFLGYYFSSFLDFKSLEYISAGLERVILFTFPAWVMLISAAWHRTPIRARDLLSLALSFAGVVVTFAHDIRLSGSSSALWTGGACVLAASVVYSIYLVGSRGAVLRIGSERFTGYVVLIAAVYVLAQFCATRPLSDLRQPTSIYWLSLGLAVVSTVLPIVFLVQALKRITPAMVAVCSSIGPFLTILMGAVFLGEPITPLQLAGATLVLAGVGLITIAPPLPD
jgi:drug/metabolite transporter (DMT)-like permease